MQEKQKKTESKQLKMSRREFIMTGVALSAAALIPGKAFSVSTNKQKVIMPTRKLGTLEVSAIGLGCMSMNSGNYNPPKNKKEMIEVIHEAVDLGVTYFDTAEAYGPFVNEILVGEALSSIKDKVVIGTKFGFDIDYKTGKRTGKLNSRPEHIRAVVDASLKRLNIDCIDLLYQHRVDPSVPIEDVAGVVKDLIQAGKVKHFGMSEPGLKTLRRAHAIQPVTAVQNEYSLLTQEPGESVFSILEELGIGLTAWSPLGIGLLTGTINANTRFESTEYTDYRLTNPQFAPDNLKANMPLVEFVRKWAEIKQATPAQISLAWLLAQKPWIVPIPGTTNIKHLHENLGAVNVQFTAAELKDFDQELDQIEIHGARLRDGLLQMSGQEAPPK